MLYLRRRHRRASAPVDDVLSHQSDGPMRTGFITDIHEDYDSLRAAFAVLEKHGCEQVICLGDIVGFTLPFQRNIHKRNAEACVAMVREQCCVVVAGNHDLYAVRKIPEYADGFHYGEDWYELDYELRERCARNRVWLYEDSELPHFLSPSAMEYVASLREYETLTVDGTTILLSHFHYPNLSGSSIRFPRSARDVREHFLFMRDHDATISFSGHGHPEGVVRGLWNSFDTHRFGERIDVREGGWFVCPCVANTSRANGVMVWDSRDRHLEVLALGSRKQFTRG